MKRALLLVALLVALPMPAQAETITVEMTATAGADVTVDLIDNAGDVLRFRAAANAFPNITADAALLRMSCDCASPLALTMSKSGDSFVRNIPVDDDALLAGEWNVTVVGTSNTQGQDRLPVRTLQVTATADTTAPVLTVKGLDEELGVLKLRAGEALDADVSDDLLHKVTYFFVGTPAPVELAAPYRIPVSSFEPGTTSVVISASDRAGHVTSLPFDVYADDEDPDVEASLPTTLFNGIPNAITFSVSEVTPFNVTVRGVGAPVTAHFDNVTETVDVLLNVTPDMVGSHILEVIVQDALDNRVTITQTVDVVLVVTDVHLVDATVAGGPVLANTAQRLTVHVEQKIGVTDIPAQVYYGNTLVGEMTIELGNETSNATFPLRLRAGQHTGPVRIVTNDLINETGPGDETMDLLVEAFMGRVIYGEARYHIRANGNGLPDVAVGADGNTYDLTLESMGLGSVYGFDVGEVHLWWNPVSNTTVIPLADDTEPVDEDSPGIGAIGLVALLGAIAVALRRR